VAKVRSGAAKYLFLCIVMLLWLAGLWLGEVPEGDLLWRGRQHLQFRTSSGVRQQLSAAVGTDSSDDASSVSMWYHTRQSGTGEGGGLTSQLRGLALRHRHAVSKHSSISTQRTDHISLAT